MAEAQDVEISLGTGRLLGLFFGLVVICAIFFGLGYTVGRSSTPAVLPTESSSPNPSARSKPADTAHSPTSSADLTFYKTVEQKDAVPQLAASAEAAPPPPPPASVAPELAAPVTHGSGYIVQVAAVSKKEDADALVFALRKKSYPVFVASNAPTDSLFHVQVGPFNDVRDAEAMRSRLAGEGYNPILKK
mgnify:CR=1 FL=1